MNLAIETARCCGSLYKRRRGSDSHLECCHCHMPLVFRRLVLQVSHPRPCRVCLNWIRGKGRGPKPLPMPVVFKTYGNPILDEIHQAISKAQPEAA